MSERAERLKKSWKSRTSDSLQKARSAINQLIASEEQEKSFLVRTPLCGVAGREVAGLRRQECTASQCSKAIVLLETD